MEFPEQLVNVLQNYSDFILKVLYFVLLFCCFFIVFQLVWPPNKYFEQFMNTFFAVHCICVSFVIDDVYLHMFSFSRLEHGEE